jgi:hypothetical protein
MGISNQNDSSYSVYDLGYDRSLNKIVAPDSIPTSAPQVGTLLTSPSSSTPELSNIITDGTAPQTITTGEVVSILNAGQAGVSGDGALSTSIRFWAGETAANRASAPFRVDQDGNVTATGLSIASLDIGGADSTSFHVDSSGNMWLGNATLSGAPFSVTNAGVLIATSATITGSTVNGTGLSFQDEFGDGNDGNVTISVNTTLTRDMYYNNLTINNTIVLTAGGYKVFVKGTLTRVGTGLISRDGGAGSAGGNGGAGSGANKGTAGSAGAGATALGSGTLFGSTAGPAGGAGGGGSGGQNAGDAGAAGAAGAAITSGLGAVTSAGLAGGDGGSGTQGSGGSGGAAGAAGAFTAVVSVPRTSYMLMMGHQVNNTSVDFLRGNGMNGGSGGGGSGGGHTAANGNGGGGGGGGGGGTDGGLVFVAARTLALANSNAILQAKGGTGGTGGNGGDAAVVGGANSGGGGGGRGGSAGNGGVCVLVYSELSTGTVAFDVTAGTAGSGGTGGAANGTGTAGVAGGTGRTGTAGVTVTLVV